MATIQHLSNLHPDGQLLGQSAADLVAFHGASPTDQYAISAAVSTTAPVSVTGNTVYGFQTSAQFIALMVLVNDLRALVIEKGLAA